jgi:tRNA(adenine34) deaminase
MGNDPPKKVGCVERNTDAPSVDGASAQRSAHPTGIGSHEELMRLALGEARQALEENEVPVGAVIACGERVIAAAHNQREQLHDPTAHAEMIAITQAAESLASWRLEGCTLYVTLEPCPMCAGAIVQARIPRVVYGATDPKAGAVRTHYELLSDKRLNHQADIVAGILAEPCGELLSRFFQQQRALGKK